VSDMVERLLKADSAAVGSGGSAAMTAPSPDPANCPGHTAREGREVRLA
jgi:hypothetical protein